MRAAARSSIAGVRALEALHVAMEDGLDDDQIAADELN